MALYRCMPREQAAVQGNLTRVLPNASRQDVARQARQVFGNFACFFADLLGLNRRALALQRAYVTKVQEVKAAIGENAMLTGLLPASHCRGKLITVAYFLASNIYIAHNRHPSGSYT